MGSSLIDQMRKLRDLFWSKSDPIGRGFVPLAEVLRRLGELDEAERVLRDGLNRHPDMASGHVVAGRVHLDREDTPAAQAAFRRALELDPRNVEALRNLGQILKDQGDLNRSLKLAKRLLEEEPWNQRLSDEVQALESGVSEATLSSGSSVSDDGGAEGPWRWLSESEIQEGLDWNRATLQHDDSAGVEEIPTREAEEVVPGHEEEWILAEGPEPLIEPREDGALVTRTLGEIYLRQGLLTQAKEVFSELVRQTPEDASLLQRLAEIESRLDAGGSGPVVAIQDLAPVVSESVGPQIVVPIDLLAPDPDAVGEPSVQFESWVVGPEGPVPVVSVEALAPDDVPETERESHGSSGPGGILDDFKDWLDNLP